MVAPERFCIMVSGSVKTEFDQRAKLAGYTHDEMLGVLLFGRTYTLRKPGKVSKMVVAS